MKVGLVFDSDSGSVALAYLLRRIFPSAFLLHTYQDVAKADTAQSVALELGWETLFLKKQEALVEKYKALLRKCSELGITRLFDATRDANIVILLHGFAQQRCVKIKTPFYDLDDHALEEMFHIQASDDIDLEADEVDVRSSIVYRQEVRGSTEHEEPILNKLQGMGYNLVYWQTVESKFLVIGEKVIK
ncbi:MAG: hypothetical protein ACTSPB_21970 [Candidatus Thorarchaeota archaeon]